MPRARSAAGKKATGYADHSWCITIEEAVEIGLNATEMEEDCLDVVWQIHRLYREKEALILVENEKKMREKMKDLPPYLQDILSPDTVEDDKQKNGAE